jgi:hypothetical protein
MQLNLIPAAANATTVVNQVAAKMEPATSSAQKVAPNLSMSPAQINRTFEISKDPPVTILKYTNAVTKEVEMQIPSEASIQIYKETQRFIAEQTKQQNTVNVAV